MGLATKTERTSLNEKKQGSFFSGSEKSKSKKYFFQPKLAIGPVDDVYEREADAIADKVMRMPDNNYQQSKSAPPVIQRKCAACDEEEHVQRKEETRGDDINTSSLIANTINSSGSPLPNDTKTFMQDRIGHDFSNVKIHTDTVSAKSAQSINALAYTSGNNIVFNEGQYSPNTSSGKKLLAHELTHVVQQSNTKAHTVQRKEAGVCDPAQLGTLGPLFNKPEADVKKLGLKEIQLADQAAVAGAEDFLLYCPHKWSIALNRLVPSTSVYRIQGGPANDRDQFWAHQPGEANMIWGFIKKDVINKWAYFKATVPKDKSAANTPSNNPAPQDPANTGERLYYFDLDQDSGMLTQTGVSLPNAHPKYVEKQTVAVGFGIYLGGYQLFCDGIEDKPILVPEGYVDFSLTEATIASDVIYNNRAAALKAEAEANASAEPGAPRRVAYYWGAGGAIVVPTVFSPATTPSTILTMLKDRKELAEYVKNAMADLLISMVGGKLLGKVSSWANNVGRGPVKGADQLLREWGVTPKPPSVSPPPLKLLPGGNSGKILMKDGNVVSTPVQSVGGGNDAVLGRGDSAVPKTQPNPVVVPQPRPQLELVPDPVPVQTPNQNPGVQPPTAGPNPGTTPNQQKGPALGPIPKPDPEWSRDERKGCVAEAVAQRGGNTCHDQFATSISGVSREWGVRTPEGSYVEFDGLGHDGTLYEIKTGYGYLLGTDKKNEPMRQTTRERFINQSEEQLLVASRCGYQLKWVFNKKEVAELVNGFIQPTVGSKNFECDMDK